MLTKANIYMGATHSLHDCHICLLPASRDIAALFCNFVLVRLLLFGTALSFTDKFYFVVLLVEFLLIYGLTQGYFSVPIKYGMFVFQDSLW
jgi:hypothetical protein